MYNELVLSYFFHPEHAGTLENAIHVQVKNMALYIQHEGNIIKKAAFRSNGNPYKIAGLEWLCRLLEAHAISSHPRVNYKEIARVLEIPPSQYADAIALESIYKQLIAEIRG